MRMKLKSSRGTSTPWTRTIKQSIFDFETPNEQHEAIDLTKFLEEQEIPVPNADKSTFTDKFVPLKPPSPYIPVKCGIDCGTDDQGSDFFDFNRDMDPILTVLTTKVIEQALEEVGRERDIQKLTRRFQKLQGETKNEKEEQDALEKEVCKRSAQKLEALAKRKEDADRKRSLTRKTIEQQVFR